MNTRIRSIVLSALLSVCSVQHVSGFAQTNTGDEQDELRSSQSVVLVYVAAQSAAFDIVDRAPNLIVASSYQPIVDMMLSRSPTFRRQCARIARAPHLSVAISSHPPPGTRLPALTRIIRQAGGRLQAVVNIVPGLRTAELIAHEIEHIIEQLDGVDLRAKSRLRASGVHRTSDMTVEAFETSRAIATGLRVAREVVEPPRGGSSP